MRDPHPAGSLGTRHGAPRRGELRRPIPLPASRPSVVTQYPTPRRAEHPRHPAPEQGASAGSRDNHGPVRQRSETAARAVA